MDVVRQHKRSLWLGALVSPLVIPLCYALFFGAGTLFDGRLGLFVKVVLPILLAVGQFSYPATLVFVLPMAFLLRARNALTAKRLRFWCLFIGPGVFFCQIWITSGFHAAANLLASLFGVNAAIVFAIHGWVSGAIFCLVSGVRPRESAQPPAARS